MSKRITEVSSRSLRALFFFYSLFILFALSNGEGGVVWLIAERLTPIRRQGDPVYSRRRDENEKKDKKREQL